MNWKLILGLSSILTGLILILNSKSNLIGGVIGSNETGSIINVILIFIILFIGLVSIVLARGNVGELEKILTVEPESIKYNVSEVGSYVDAIRRYINPGVIVIDTNVILDYKLEALDYFINQFDGSLIVTDTTLSEVYNKDKKRPRLTGVNANTLYLRDREKRLSKRELIAGEMDEEEPSVLYDIPKPEYQERARNYLEKTSKTMFYKAMILMEEIPLEYKMKYKYLFKEYKKEVQRILKEGGNLEDTYENRKMVARDFDTSNGDIDVLASAIYYAIKMKDKKRNKIAVSSRDSHLREAIEMIRNNSDLEYGKRICYAPNNDSLYMAMYEDERKKQESAKSKF